jgi:hypothetical protein
MAPVWWGPHSDVNIVAKSLERPGKVHFSPRKNGHFRFPAGHIGPVLTF